MPEDIGELVKRMEEKYPGGSSANSQKKTGFLKKISSSVGDFLLDHKLSVGLAGLVVAGGLALGYVLVSEYLIERKNYPTRNVLFEASETIRLANVDLKRSGSKFDRKSETNIYRGSPDGAKVSGDILGKVRINKNDQITNLEMDDTTKIRTAAASTKRENIQAGASPWGAMDLTEINAEIVGEPERLVTYYFTPKRGLRNIQLNMLVDKTGNTKFVNELITYRTIGLGFLWGTKYRSQTDLNEFADTERNKTMFAELKGTISEYNKPGLSTDEREDLVTKILEITGNLDKTPIYSSLEDGLFDWLPQESTTYLFGNFNFGERLGAYLPNGNKAQIKNPVPESPSLDSISRFDPLCIQNEKRDVLRLRVENQWDLWPGDYWLLNNISFGDPPHVIRPFAHRNNGGYTIEDSKGIIAKIEIKDFWLHYGDDLLYSYFLDKNGDGKIDREKELIGQVLFRVSGDSAAISSRGEISGDVKKDVNFIYTFMAGYGTGKGFKADHETHMQDFYLANTIESFIVNEINRGFGKHSDLGFINSQRSNILFKTNKTLPNFARALTAESTLVAKYDIVSLLKAAGRGEYVTPYTSTAVDCAK